MCLKKRHNICYNEFVSKGLTPKCRFKHRMLIILLIALVRLFKAASNK